MRDIDIVLELHARADELEHFGFERYFTHAFIKQFKGEIPALMREARRDHYLGKIKPNRFYPTRLQKRIVKNRRLLDAESSDVDNDDDEVEWQ